MAQRQTAYDAIPYPSNPFRYSRPERLAAVARLFGMEATAPAGCRVLELGCSMGGNLMVIAQDHPGARCLGIDASSRQIAEGWKTIDALGLKNIQLRHQDILEVGEDLGQFDYIISHGVFSWVATEVQDRMLEICKRHLAPEGIAYISYNTYPGWHIRGIVRDMMLYRGMQFADPDTRLAQAKSLVAFVAKASRDSDTPYQRLLQSELEHIGRMEDYYLHHEHLEENNQPLYFHEFARRLAVNGLQYLGDAEFSTMVSSNFSPEVAATLNELGAHDLIQMEQYMDYVRCRYFRKSLICHSGVRLNRTITPAVVSGMLLASNAESGAADTPGDAVFRTPAGGKITCRSPLTKAALRLLRREWPMPVAFDSLVARSRADASASGYEDDEATAREFLASEMLIGMAGNVVEWYLAPAPFTTAVGERPATSPLARLQAGQGYRVTNLRGELVTLDEIHRQTLRQLDGERDHGQLVETLLEAMRRNELVLHRDADKTVVTDDAERRELLGPALRTVLENLARRALISARA
ncbi:MAG TPA: class I SAM-dependent methyltransferase [Burkholderiales bacterium]|nr:class I SAM-dependent methyltransferase [Burkholderiales bacterium]